MKKYRFHIHGLIHLPVSEKYTACAFTQKIIKLSKMMLSLGHEVYVYGAEGSDCPCTEFIQTHSLEDIRKHLGDGHDSELGYDYFGKGLNEIEMNLKSKPYLNGKWLMTIAKEIRKRKRDDDFLLLPVANPALDELVGLKLTVESGIGYYRSQARFKAFESFFIMNYTYGSDFGKHVLRPSPYDRVLPNYFDNDDFEKFINKISFRGRENDKQNSFIYCDPPYLGTTDNYSNSFTENDSLRLFNCLQNAGCKFAISEFDNDFVLSQAKERGLNIIYIGERKNIGNRRTEILITNYEKQKSLFD